MAETFLAFTKQQNAVAEIGNAVHALPQDIRSRIVVGGYPVKAGLINAIPATEFSSDISSLQIA